VSAHMADEVDADTPRSLVVEVTIQAQRLQMALELAAQEGRRLAASGIAGFLAA